MYELEFTHRAEKDIRSLDKRYKKAIANRLTELKTNPLLGKSLGDNLKGLRSLREGVYRIIYEVQKKRLVILIITISHRQSVYKKLK